MYHTEIRVRGKISPSWSEWFGELQLQEVTCNETLFIGELPDMAAVLGIISGLGSLVVPLISVCCVEETETDATCVDNHEPPHTLARPTPLLLPDNSDDLKGGQKKWVP